MEEPVYLIDSKSDNKALKYEELRAEGIQLLQQLTGAFWTDYNEHDPGVTILEQLCYAITDLAYRTDFNIEDHLYTEHNNSFFRPDEILPCNALTISDYRKLLFDSVFEIKNVWLIPTDIKSNSINGLYKILLDVDDNIKSQEQKSDIVKRAKEVFYENRNVCEDVEEIHILEHIPVAIHADVEVDGTISPEKLLAKILYQVDEYLCPEMRFYSLNELLHDGYELHEIFDGPLLKHGFVKKEELPPKSDKILISEIMKIIMQVEGVSSVKNLKLSVNGKEYENQIDIKEYQLPKLQVDSYNEGGQHTVGFFKGVVNYSLLDQQIVKRTLNEMKSVNRRVYRLTEEHIEVPKGNKINIKDYYSIQNQFPVSYGIGEGGVPHSPSIKRKAQAKQLKGYLMLFEQVLANYLAQLANGQKLLAIRSNISQTYFYQYLDTVPDAKPLFKEEDKLAKGSEQLTDYYKGLTALIERGDDFNDRRNRFLDYLLAVHGEEFSQNSLLQFNYYFEDDEFQKYLIENKTKFLEFLPFINKNRARGFNYTKSPDAPGNISGLEAKLIVLLGLNSYSLLEEKDRRSYIKNSFLSQFEQSGVKLIREKKNSRGVQSKAGEVGTKVISAEVIANNFDYIDSEEINLDDFDKDYLDSLLKRISIFDAKKLPEHFLREGLEIQNYQVGQIDKSADYNLAYCSKTNDEWRSLGQFKNEEEAESAALLLTNFLRDMNLSSEGLHIMEHVLLRPGVNDKKFGLYILNSEGKKILRSADTYSYSDRLKMLEDLKPHLSSYDNYSVEITETKDFEIHFKTPDEKIKLVSVEANPSVEETHSELEDMFSFLSDAEVVTPYEKKLDFYIRNSQDGPLVPESFYAYRITMLFPAWTARFKNPEFRSIAEEIVFQNQSASVASSIHWLEVDEMEQFEKFYFNWLKNIQLDSSKEHTDKSVDNLTQYLVRLNDKA